MGLNISSGGGNLALFVYFASLAFLSTLCSFVYLFGSLRSLEAARV